MSFNELLHEKTARQFPIDAISLGIFLSSGIFVSFVFTGFANGVISLGTLHLQTLFALILMLAFPMMALLVRFPSQHSDFYTNKPTPLRSAQGPTVVLLGIVTVFVAQFIVLKTTPAYAIFTQDLTGLILGVLSPLKAFYAYMGMAEEYFFGFGLQAYTERSTGSPLIGILMRIITFTAYHQFVYQSFSVVIVAAGAVLALVYYYVPRLELLIGIHAGVNLILA